MKSKIGFRMIAAMFLFCSCATKNNDPFVHQKFLINIQNGKTVTVQMKKLVGEHMVGIHCSSQTWNALTNSPRKLAVQIKVSDKKDAHIYAVDLGWNGTLCDQLPDTHYLFAISAIGRAVVEITFPQLPSEDSNAEIIVCKTPEQTEH